MIKNSNFSEKGGKCRFSFYKNIIFIYVARFSQIIKINLSKPPTINMRNNNVKDFV